MSKYATVVVDPPWQVAAGRSIGRYEVIDGKQPFGVTDNAARKLAYPSMSVAQIADLQVPAANDAHLYLWTINARTGDGILSVWPQRQTERFSTYRAQLVRLEAAV